MTENNNYPTEQTTIDLEKLCPSGGPRALLDLERTIKDLITADRIINVPQDPKKRPLPNDIFKKEIYKPYLDEKPNLLDRFIDVAMDLAAYDALPMEDDIQQENLLVLNLSLQCAFGLVRNNTHLLTTERMTKFIYLGFFAKRKTVHARNIKDYLSETYKNPPQNGPARADVIAAIETIARGKDGLHDSFKALKNFAGKLSPPHTLNAKDINATSEDGKKPPRFKKQGLYSKFKHRPQSLSPNIYDL